MGLALLKRMKVSKTRSRFEAFKSRTGTFKNTEHFFTLGLKTEDQRLHTLCTTFAKGQTLRSKGVCPCIPQLSHKGVLQNDALRGFAPKTTLYRSKTALM